MSQELEEGKCSYPDTSCTGQAQGRSWIRFGFLKAKKSAEVIVGELPYEWYGMSVEVERTDWPSYPTPEVISEGLNVALFQCILEVYTSHLQTRTKV